MAPASFGQSGNRRYLPRLPRQASIRRVELIVLGSGSSGNTAVLRGTDTTIMIDAGLGPRKTLARLAAVGLEPDQIHAILLTHEHGDHAGGLPALLKTLRCPVYATRLTAEEVRNQDPRNEAAEWKLFRSGSTFAVGSLEVTAFSVPHDAADPVALVQNAESGEGRGLGSSDRFHVEAGAKEHRHALVHNDQRGPVAFFGHDADIRLTRSGSDLPVDGTHVVTGQVAAQFFEVQPPAPQA